MALTSRDRIRLKRAIAREVEDTWSWDHQNLLLGEFGIPMLEDGRYDAFADRLATISDEHLVEMYAAVFDVDPERIDVVAAGSTDSLWRPGYVRLFISHVSDEREFTQQIADELAVVGIHGFVAHETMEIGENWQRQIEAALRTMDAFLALVHPTFKARSWCQQEVGWAFGRSVPRLAIRLAEDPVGFLGSDQWRSMLGRSANEVASEVSSWVGRLPDLGEAVLDGLINALADARNYFDAEAAAKRVVALGSISDDAFRRIDEVWCENDQLHGGILPTKVMQPFYLENGRSWPPGPPSHNVTDAEEPC